MSEHSDDGFDRWLAAEDVRFVLLDQCEEDRTKCDWEPDEDGLLACKTCGKVVDI